MPLIFYPYEEDLSSGSLEEKLGILLESAERYKAAVLDSTTAAKIAETTDVKKKLTPKDILFAYNWDEIAKVLRTIRDLPETNPAFKSKKGKYILKLSEVYEVLRGAKMPKLEAVRLALVNEARQLNSGSAA